jgi:hypothetical protein
MSKQIVKKQHYGEGGQAYQEHHQHARPTEVFGGPHSELAATDSAQGPDGHHPRHHSPGQVSVHQQVHQRRGRGQQAVDRGGGGGHLGQHTQREQEGDEQLSAADADDGGHDTCTRHDDMMTCHDAKVDVCMYISIRTLPCTHLPTHLPMQKAPPDGQ